MTTPPCGARWAWTRPSPVPLTLLASAPTLVSVVNGVVAAAIGAIAALQVGADTGIAVAIGVVAFPAIFMLQGWFGAREATRERPDFAPMFPPEPD